ncbi:MAG: hypothetical protein ABH821_00745 [archaeon]
MKKFEIILTVIFVIIFSFNVSSVRFQENFLDENNLKVNDCLLESEQEKLRLQGYFEDTLVISINPVEDISSFCDHEDNSDIDDLPFCYFNRLSQSFTVHNTGTLDKISLKFKNEYEGSYSDVQISLWEKNVIDKKKLGDINIHDSQIGHYNWLDIEFPNEIVLEKNQFYSIFFHTIADREHLKRVEYRANYGEQYYNEGELLQYDLRGKISGFWGENRLVPFRVYFKKGFQKECQVISKEINKLGFEIESARLDVNHSPNNQEINYFLSSNNGVTWKPVNLKETIYFESGHNLKWRAVLETKDTNFTPAIETITIDYNYMEVPEILVNKPVEWEILSKAKNNSMIDFNLKDYFNNAINLDINYFDYNNLTTKIVVNDLNLFDKNYCPEFDGNYQKEFNCIVDWNTENLNGYYRIDLNADNSKHSIRIDKNVLIDNNKPILWIIEPENNQVFEDNNILIEFKGTDNNLSGVKEFFFKLNDENWFSVGLNESYNLNLDFGEHTVKVKAIDNALNESEAAIVNFSVRQPENEENEEEENSENGSNNGSGGSGGSGGGGEGGGSGGSGSSNNSNNNKLKENDQNYDEFGDTLNFIQTKNLLNTVKSKALNLKQRILELQDFLFDFEKEKRVIERIQKEFNLNQSIENSLKSLSELTELEEMIPEIIVLREFQTENRKVTVISLDNKKHSIVRVENTCDCNITETFSNLQLKEITTENKFLVLTLEPLEIKWLKNQEIKYRVAKELNETVFVSINYENVISDIEKSKETTEGKQEVKPTGLLFLSGQQYAGFIVLIIIITTIFVIIKRVKARKRFY